MKISELNKNSNKNDFWKIFWVSFGTLIFLILLVDSLFVRILPAEISPREADPRLLTSLFNQGFSPEIERPADRSGVDFSADESDRTSILRVRIASVGIDTQVLYPPSRSIDVLDQYLTKGAVYYPGSGTPAEGNVFIFGHSTNWPIVRNQAYKTFNNLENVMVGDVIELYGENGKIYKYIVQNVKTVDDNEALVRFDSSTRKLTISTCNTFGKAQERHVVEAVLME